MIDVCKKCNRVLLGCEERKEVLFIGFPFSAYSQKHVCRERTSIPSCNTCNRLRLRAGGCTTSCIFSTIINLGFASMMIGVSIQNLIDIQIGEKEVVNDGR